MYLVDQNGDAIAKAQYEFQSILNKEESPSDQFAILCQDSKLFATYWKQLKGIQFIKNQKKVNRIFTNYRIKNVSLQNTLTAILNKDGVNIYSKKNKLITKTKIICANEQLTFNKDKLIMFQSNIKAKIYVQIYDFINKRITICDEICSVSYHEYCPCYNIILIPSGSRPSGYRHANYLTVWSVDQSKIVNEVATEFVNINVRVKMTRSGKYFVIAYRSYYTLELYSFGDKITCLLRIGQLKVYQDVEWIFDDRFLLIHGFFEYWILDISNKQTIQCKIQNPQQRQINCKYEPSNQSQICIFKIKEVEKTVNYFSIRI